MIQRITVIGAGTMGHGIAHAALLAGYETVMYDLSADALTRGREAVDQIIRRSVELGKIAADAVMSLEKRFTTTPDLARALEDTDFVIEAAPEQIDLKLKLFADIDRLAPNYAIVTSNTSALSLTEMAGVLENPERAAGMHFFNPVHKMRLVEIVQALKTAPETIEAVQDVATLMGKEHVPRLHHDAHQRQPRQRGVLHVDGRCGLGPRHRQSAEVGPESSDGTVRARRSRGSGHAPQHPRVLASQFGREVSSMPTLGAVCGGRPLGPQGGEGRV
jgi:hypothetical protein